jgi:hypothetical protein
LTISLVRELPELLKPRKIEIGSVTAPTHRAKAKVVGAANDEIEAAYPVSAGGGAPPPPPTGRGGGPSTE